MLEAMGRRWCCGTSVVSVKYYMKTLEGDKLGKGPEEVKLQNASKQIVETVILQAVQQISEEDNKKENNQDRSVGQTLTTRRVHHEKK
ncbi:unnamed protein product [Ranitomeya imitator]|uniref:A-kinase anchor protein 7 RI-RII subunit-binding domain-containing protein n=1 Tax=Ranitomeya imitator TaxID=111125 RepID=A0ABN9LPU8_9NEOB|nr:unnamed protein product [Ranitomeya imitator]